MSYELLPDDGSLYKDQPSRNSLQGQSGEEIQEIRVHRPRTSEALKEKEEEICGLPRDPLRTLDFLWWVLRGLRGELAPLGEARTP